jgi:hypothetical protein
MELQQTRKGYQALVGRLRFVRRLGHFILLATKMKTIRPDPVQ